MNKSKSNSKEVPKQASKTQAELTGVNARMQSFQGELDKLQKKYAVELYAAIAVQQNGEILPVIKMRDVLNLVINK